MSMIYYARTLQQKCCQHAISKMNLNLHVSFEISVSLKQKEPVAYILQIVLQKLDIYVFVFTRRNAGKLQKNSMKH